MRRCQLLNTALSKKTPQQLYCCTDHMGSVVTEELRPHFYTSFEVVFLTLLLHKLLPNAGIYWIAQFPLNPSVLHVSPI